MQQIHPVAVVDFSIVYISKRCKIPTGDKAFSRIGSIFSYVIRKETAADLNIGTIAEDSSIKGAAAQRVLRCVKAVAVGIVVERISAFECTAGYIQRRLHCLRRIRTRKLDP